MTSQYPYWRDKLRAAACLFVVVAMVSVASSALARPMETVVTAQRPICIKHPEFCAPPIPIPQPTPNPSPTGPKGPGGGAGDQDPADRTTDCDNAERKIQAVSGNLRDLRDRRERIAKAHSALAENENASNEMAQRLFNVVNELYDRKKQAEKAVWGAANDEISAECPGPKPGKRCAQLADSMVDEGRVIEKLRKELFIQNNALKQASADHEKAKTGRIRAEGLLRTTDRDIAKAEGKVYELKRFQAACPP